MDKAIIPTKTKIVAWIMRVTGAIYTFSFISIIAYDLTITPPPPFSLIIGIIIGFLIPQLEIFFGISYSVFPPLAFLFLIAVGMILFSQFLFNRKKWVWIASVVLLFSLFSLSLLLHQLLLVYFRLYLPYTLLIPQLIFYGLPLLLLLLDKKNYWQVAS